MTTEHQPGSPGVDLDHLDFLHAEATSGLGSVAGKMKRFENFSFALMNQWGAISAELRTLRARVAELEMPDTEADRILTMSAEELDAEIRAVGIDPAELDKRASHVAKWAAECSKLRARVVERGALIRKLDAEFSSARVGVMGMFGQLHEHLELMISYLEHEGAQGDGISEEHWDGYQAAKALLAKTAPDAPQWENAQIETADLLRRAESAEARVAALEKLFDDAGQGNYNVLALIDHYQSEAMAESERRRAAEARVKELEAWVRDLESDARADAEMLHKRDYRITDLESQLAAAKQGEVDAILAMAKARGEKMDAESRGMLNAWFVHEFETDGAAGLVKKLWDKAKELESQLAAAREEQGLALQVRDWLREECIKLTVAVRPADGRWVADLFNEDDPENFFASVEAETLPALLRAILEVENKS